MLVPHYSVLDCDVRVLHGVLSHSSHKSIMTWSHGTILSIVPDSTVPTRQIKILRYITALGHVDTGQVGTISLSEQYAAAKDVVWCGSDSSPVPESNLVSLLKRGRPPTALTQVPLPL